MLDAAALQERGFAITQPLFNREEIGRLRSLIESTATVERARGGVRDVMSLVPELAVVADSGCVRALAEQVLGMDCFPVRATLFDKTPETNWKVPWHQDVTIAVSERIDLAGYGPWSRKLGIDHVQPPSHVLAKMITIRLHLDDCSASNGALRVVAGSHLLGRLNQNEVEPYIIEEKIVTCAMRTGELLVMRPLLLHASSSSTTPGHRRVLHFDFAVGDLDGGLRWKLRS